MSCGAHDAHEHPSLTLERDGVVHPRNPDQLGGFLQEIRQAAYFTQRSAENAKPTVASREASVDMGSGGRGGQSFAGHAPP